MPPADDRADEALRVLRAWADAIRARDAIPSYAAMPCAGPTPCDRLSRCEAHAALDDAEYVAEQAERRAAADMRALARRLADALAATPEERAELQAAADRDGQSLQAWLLSRALRAARRA